MQVSYICVVEGNEKQKGKGNKSKNTSLQICLIYSGWVEGEKMEE